MKVMDKLDPTSENEQIMLWKISHENVVRYFDHFNQELDGSLHTCVVIEFCEVILSIFCF